MKVEVAIQQILSEYNRACDKFPAFNSDHEGCAIIREELDELWDAVKRNERSVTTRAEAKQLAAMALRFMVDRT